MLPEIHPGEKNVIGTCMRQAYYRFNGEPQADFSEYTQWIFFSGKSLEQGLVDNWKEMGILLANNIKFYSSEWMVSGEFDAVVKHPDKPNEKLLVEIKTYYGYEATKLICGNPKKGISGEPKDAHLLQVLIYMYLHQHIFSESRLVYLDRTCKDNAEFKIELHKEGDKTYPVINGVVKRRFYVEQIFERFKILKDYIEKKTLPPREFEKEYSVQRVEREFAAKNISPTKYKKWTDKKEIIGDWNCRYCNYSDKCWSNNPDVEEKKEVTSDKKSDITISPTMIQTFIVD